MLSIGAVLMVRGFVTDEKFLRGQSLAEIEKRLGFHRGRLEEGATFALADYPSLSAFNFRGYSQVAGHHFDEQYGHIQLDVVQAKKNLLKSWQERKAQLIKVLPNIRHDPALSNDEQYPPGSGVPQWEITRDTRARVVAIYQATAYQRHIPYHRMQYLHNQIT